MKTRTEELKCLIAIDNVMISKHYQNGNFHEMIEAVNTRVKHEIELAEIERN